MAKHIHIMLGQHPRVITTDRAILTRDDFQEHEHKRDADGKFSSTGGGASAAKGAPVLTPHMKETLKAKGFEPTKQKSKAGAVIYENKAKGIKIHASTHNKEGKATSSFWQSEMEGKGDKRGKGSKDLDKLLSSAPEPKLEPTPSPAAEPTEKAPTMSVAKAHGYEAGKLTPTGKTVWRTYNHPNGATFHAAISGEEKGKWVSGAPNKQTKSGMGLEKLEMLLSGKVPPGAQNHFGNTPDQVFAALTGEKSTPAAATPAKVAPAKPKAESKAQVYEKLLKGMDSPSYEQAAKGYKLPTPEQHSAISSYVGSGYANMNPELRTSRGKTVSAHSKHLTDYLEQASFPEQMVVSRGIKGAFAEALASSLDEGSIFVDHGFVSTGVGFNFHGAAHMKVTVPKGAKAAAISHIGGNTNEREVLLQRGSRFHVDKVEGNTFHVTLLPPKEKK